jgi:hypothetical protein
MQRRRRSVLHTFEENLAGEKAKLEAQVARLKPGPQMDELLRKIRQLETALHINEWLPSGTSTARTSSLEEIKAARVGGLFIP